MPKSIFFALKGDKFNANAFAAEALQKGASHVVIDQADSYVDERTILVSDVLTTLQDLARYHRDYLRLTIIALTGSNGKTTTKELLQAVLSKKFNTAATIGNLNNHIGVPLTLLSFTRETQIGIVEMGANHQHEIAFLCTIAKPDYGYITNFGKAHLEGFGSPEGVIRAKSELYDFLSANGKMVFINLDDPIQEEKTRLMNRFTFGIRTNADVTIPNSTANPFVVLDYGQSNVTSHLIGIYNSGNISAAVAIGKYFAVSDSDIKDAIEGYVPQNNRSQLIHKNGNEIILDAYNANPSSMAAAIQNFLNLEGDNKMMILGDMFELGENSHDEHRQILNILENEYSVLCHFIGHDFCEVRIPKDHFHFYETFEELAEKLKSSRPENKKILIKGSRGMALERVLDLI